MIKPRLWAGQTGSMKKSRAGSLWAVRHGLGSVSWPWAGRFWGSVRMSEFSTAGAFLAMPAPAQACSGTSGLPRDRIPDSGYDPPIIETDLAALYRGPSLPEAGLSAGAGRQGEVPRRPAPLLGWRLIKSRLPSSLFSGNRKVQNVVATPQGSITMET